MSKAALLLLVKSAPDPNPYTIDKLFLDAGHTVKRLPPYDYHLNRIKLVWGDIKLGEFLTENMAVKKAMCVKLFSEYSSER